MTPLARHAATIIVAFASLVVLGAGCADDRRAVPKVARDLTRADDPTPITIPLAPRPLTTQAAFDALEEEYEGRLPVTRLIAIYRALSDGADPAKRPEDALLLQRLALLQLGAADGGTARLQQAFGTADRLRNGAPDSPHAIYLLARVKRMLLVVGSGDNTFRLTPKTRDIAEQLRDDWKKLLTVAPEYLGPDGETAASLRADLASLQAALIEGAEAAPAAAASARGARASEGALAARRDLWRYESINDGMRRALCEERSAEKRTGGASGIERYVDLVCALELGVADRALDALDAAVALAAVGDRCSWVARIAATAGVRSPRLTAAEQACRGAGAASAP